MHSMQCAHFLVLLAGSIMSGEKALSNELATWLDKMNHTKHLLLYLSRDILVMEIH